VLLGSDNGGTVTPTDASVTSSKLSGNIDAPGTLSTTLSNSTQTTPGLTINNTVSGGYGAALAFDVFRSDSSSQATAARIYPSRADVWSSDAASDADLNFQVSQDGTVATRMTVSGTGDVLVTDGNLTFSGAGHGVYLGVTSADAANLLDDYEEGTWSIILEDHSDNAMTLNSSYNTGTYVKVGGLVTLTGYANVDAVGSASGSMRISGLPYSILGNSRNYTSMSIGYAAGLSITAGTSVAGVGIINTQNVNLTNYDVTAGTTNLDASKLTNDAQFIFSISYMTI
jgi:hypothetical protein